MINIAVIIPAYNESGIIRETINEVLEVFHEVPDVRLSRVMVIDDNSSDDTFGTVTGMNDDRISAIRLSRRSGSNTAVRVGLLNIDCDAAFCIAADGQDSPACFIEMIEKLKTGANVVWGLRRNRENESISVSLPARLFYKLLSWASNIDTKGIDLSRADFFLLDRVVISAINTMKERNTSIMGQIAWTGFVQQGVEYERRARRHGSSKWTLRSRLRLAKDWIIAFSGLPLKLMPFLGIFISFLGFIYAIVVILNKIFGHPMGGWSSIMVAVLILGGIQIIMLGIIGEYLWRTLDESRQRSLFFIERDSRVPAGNLDKG